MLHDSFESKADFYKELLSMMAMDAGGEFWLSKEEMKKLIDARL